MEERVRNMRHGCKNRYGYKTQLVTCVQCCFFLNIFFENFQLWDAGVRRPLHTAVFIFRHLACSPVLAPPYHHRCTYPLHRNHVLYPVPVPRVLKHTWCAPFASLGRGFVPIPLSCERHTTDPVHRVQFRTTSG